MARLIAENISLYFPCKSTFGEEDTKSAKVGGDIVEKGGKRYVRALNNVSFELNDGDRLGLVGHNGAGKSTLLQVLARIYTPQEGRVITEGSVGNALNLSLGFRNEASGRRNILVRGLIAGLSKSDVEIISKEIIEFTCLGPYIDQPLNTYSQGMRARLAFAIVTAFQYDILLLDEWLGAGDSSFRDQAVKRMNSFSNACKILVTASHSDVVRQRMTNAEYNFYDNSFTSL